MSEGSGNEITQRRAKLEEYRSQGLNPFANGFVASATAEDVNNAHTGHDAATLADGGSFNDRIYGIPTGRVTYSGMFVNTTLLDEVGVAVPTTWEELVAACETIKAANFNCMTAGGGDGKSLNAGRLGCRSHP